MSTDPYSGILGTARTFAETGGWLTPESKDPRVPDVHPLSTNLGQALGEAPLGDLLTSMMKAVGNAQFQLDIGAAKIAQLMAGMEVDGMTLGSAGRFPIGMKPGQPGSGTSVTLLELGFTPTFYQFDEVELEVKVTMKMRQELLDSRSAWDLAASGKAGGLKNLGDFTAASMLRGPARGGNLIDNVTTSFKGLADGTRGWKSVLGWGPKVKVGLNVSTVDTKTSNTYGMSAEGSASLSAVMAPVPPPPQLVARLQALLPKPSRVVDVPSLTGLSWSEAMAALVAAGIPYTMSAAVESDADRADKAIGAYTPVDVIDTANQMLLIEAVVE